MKPETQQPRQQQEAKQQKLGKKEAALVAAQNPNTETTLGELMARRQGGLNS